MAHKLKRTLHIGLGGTGAKVLLQVKRCYLEAYGKIPPMISFLAIDTDNAATDYSLTARNGAQIKLGKNEIMVCRLFGSALDIYNMNRRLFEWIPQNNVRHLGGLKNTGAGQVRSNGRFLIQHNQSEVLTRIQSELTYICRPLPKDNEFEVDMGQGVPTYINVIASIAGGTGAGTVIDLLVLLCNRLHTHGTDAKVRPWLVMPDIFRYNYPGLLTENVYKNAYGVLRELDYLYHMENGSKPLSFRFCDITGKPEELGDTILINMRNTQGIAYQSVNDITETVGRCLYIDSNKYSSGIGSAFDNTGHFDGHNIRNKVAHYFSAGSAELVYDSNAVANVVADTMISEICDSLLSRNSVNAESAVNAWTKLPEVSIQEHEMDQLTDDLLPIIESYQHIEIGKETTAVEIENFINVCARQPQIEESVRKKYNEKLANFKAQLDAKIEDVINKNGVGNALEFLNKLQDNIDLCKQEMVTELAELQQKNSITKNWQDKLSGLRTLLFFFNQDAADDLAREVEYVTSLIRDELRHQWAINFYTAITPMIDNWKLDVQRMVNNVNEVKEQRIDCIRTIRNVSVDPSQFQILLHKEDVTASPQIDIMALMNSMRGSVNIADYLGKPATSLDKALWDYAVERPDVKNTASVTIEQKLSEMPKEKILELMDRLKTMSSPLWNTQTRGYEEVARTLVSLFVIGTTNGTASIINDEEVTRLLTIDGYRPDYVPTNLTDRITLIHVQSSNPVYAVVNMQAYEQEAALSDMKKYGIEYFVDTKWNERMKKEHFSVLPKENSDNNMELWTQAIIFGIIGVNPQRDEYYMNSEQGDMIFGGYLSLGTTRDLAYSTFCEKDLGAEISEKMAKIINSQGMEAVLNKVAAIKGDIANYVSQYAHLRPFELERVLGGDQYYQAVTNLLREEIEIIRNSGN